MQIKAKFPSVC